MTPSAPMPKQPAYLVMQRLAVRARVAVEIALWRHGRLWAVFAGLLLAVGGVAGGARWSLAQDAEQLRHERETLAERQRAAAQRETSAAQAAVGSSLRADSDAEKRAQLLAVLPPREQVAEQVRRLYQLAAQQQVLIAQADFQSSADASGVERLQVSIPAKAPYPQLRRFVESSLRALPNASLDRLSFKRNQVGETEIEVRVYLSLWLRAGGGDASQPAGSTSAPGERP
jgi:hypothetical protein